MNAYQAGEKSLCGGYFQYTPTGAGQFKRAGRWFTTPRPGDEVFFYSASMGRISHIGIVETVEMLSDGFNMTTLEGNTSSRDFDRNGGMFLRKGYRNVTAVGGKNRIAGFGRPIYSDETCTVEELLAVAREEMLYEEKKNGKIPELFTKHENVGNNNYTKFGHWYNHGKLIPNPWCAQSVSYVFYKACVKHRENTATGWKKIKEDWTYWDSEGQVKGAWKFINGRWYVFNNAGIMIAGWFASNEGWYYLNPEDGAMLSGQWIVYNDQSYYLSKSGVMAKNAYILVNMPNGERAYYFVDERGVWDNQPPITVPNLEKYDVVE